MSAREAEIIGLPRLREKLKLLESTLREQILQAACLSGAKTIENEAKRLAPAKTANLRRSIHSEVVLSTADRCEVQVGTNAEYAAQVEFGGTILPKNGPFLVWTDGPRPTTKEGWAAAQAKGQVHRARSVTQKARPYLRPAFDARMNRCIDLVGKSFSDALQAVANDQSVPVPKPEDSE